MQEIIIPKRLKEINTAIKMMQIEKQYGRFSTTELLISLNNGPPESAHHDTLMSFTDPFIESAILNCRCLLEFLGLGLDTKAPFPDPK